MTLSGEEVVDEQRRCVGLVHTTWGTCFESLWRSVYYCTGGRVRHLVFGLAVVDGTSKCRGKWSQFLSRSEARLRTEDSPYVLPVLLRGWW